MATDDSFEIVKELPIFGKSTGRIFSRLVINKMGWHITMHAIYPSDLRFKAPIIKLYKDDISNLSVFLKGMMDKIRELKGVIPENKLYEDQTSIQTILIHYIVFQNRTKIHFYFPYRSGIGVQLTEDEVKNMLDVLNGVSAMAENIKNAITY